ncbi:uncharacterized protein [Nothobranchius furzeri]|uniref:uncharacterized protein n=1 Tax=Nothobranchius furzeri TaxID=105023 RepID=UPI003904D081
MAMSNIVATAGLGLTDRATLHYLGNLIYILSYCCLCGWSSEKMGCQDPLVSHLKHKGTKVGALRNTTGQSECYPGSLCFQQRKGDSLDSCSETRTNLLTSQRFIMTLIAEPGGRGAERRETTDEGGDREIQGGAELLLNYRTDTNFHIQHSSTYKPQTFTLFNMDCCGLSLLVVTILTGVSCEQLTAVKNKESSLEGAPVTLSYNYSRDAAIGDYFFWYRQDPGEPPEFLISHTGTETLLLQKVSGLTFTVSDDKRRVDLLISSAAATDSAVYYCAVQPTVTGNSKSV